MYNKLNRILLSLLILNLMFWNLFLIPAQTQAKLNTLGNYSCDPDINGACHSCNSEGKCVVDDNGPYSCPKCNSQCSGSTTNEAPSTSSSRCGSAPITGGGTVDVYIVGSTEQSAAEAAAQKGINTLEDLANATGLTVGLVKNKFLDLILSGLNVESICLGLANAVTGLPWGAGAAISAAIEFACPPLLNTFLENLGFFEEKLKTGESTQTLPVPTLEYYEWEVGIPGFIKSGQFTKFK